MTYHNPNQRNKECESSTSAMPRWLLQLEEELDYRLLVRLRDGRLYLGILRSFDQFGNLFLESVYQRFTAFHPELERVCYADIYMGLLIIRGDTVMLFGRMKEDSDNVSNENIIPPIPENQTFETSCQSPPVPLSSVSPSACQMVERPLEEVTRLILEYEQSGMSNSYHKNFLWTLSDQIAEDFY